MAYGAPDSEVASAAVSQVREASVAGVAVRLLPREAYCASFVPANLLIGFAFDVQSGEHSFASDRLVPFLTRPSTAAITPSGCDVRSVSGRGGEYLTIDLVDPVRLGLLDSRPCDFAARTNLASRRATDAAKRLRAALLSGCALSSEIEEASLDLAEAALAAGPHDPGRSSRGAASLTGRRLRQLNDLVESDLGTRLTISEMAAAVGLRPRFFLRAFRAATGTTPHAYLLERRLESARRRLESSDETIASIAAETGFASQAHLTAVFRRTFRLTPGEFRRRASP